MLREKVGLSWLVLAMIIALPLPTPGAAAEPQGPETAMARVEAGPARVEWLPQVDYERLILTVSGPGNRFIRREFDAGKPVFLSIFDSEGNRLPDGGYVWELRTFVKKAGQAGGVLSGYLSIQDGSFVAKPGSTSRQAPKSPPSGVTLKDLIESGNLIVKGRGCIGSSCGNSDANVDALKLKVTHPNILFDETGTGVPGGATFDWALEGNPSDVDRFSIASNDGTTILTPFTLTGGAPDNSLFVAANGSLGLGTATPGAKLHLFDSADVSTVLTIENSSTGVNAVTSLHAVSNSASAFLQAQGSGRTISHFGQAVASWGELLQVTGNGLIIGTLTNTPIILGTNNVNRAQITASGDVGIGTATPANHLHVLGSAGTNKVLIEEANGTTTSREILEIRNNGAPVLIYKDTSMPQRWSNGSLGGSFFIDEQAHTGVEFLLTNTGNLIIAGTLTQGSSRDLKTGFVALDPRDVLARVSALPVSLWSYKTESAVRHVGPMAEDFHQAFGLGADDKHIAPGDQAGVALLAVQGLSQVVQDKAQEIAALRRENAELAKRVEALEALLSAMKDEQSSPAP